MRYLSLFSGVEAATLAWEPLGWEGVAFCEYAPFPSAVLAHHWPNIPNLGDITKVTEKQIKQLGSIDIVVFGSPCQDLSIAGKRKGLDGERSGLYKYAIKIIKWCIKHCGTRFALWENVPGAFSSNEGADFCEVLSSLCGSKLTKPEKWSTAGFCFGKVGLVEWCVLDAQYFGDPQRRRRVFAFADFGDWSDREPILSHSESVLRDIETRRSNVSSATSSLKSSLASGKSVTGPILANCGKKQFIGNQEAFSGDYHIIESPCAVIPIQDKATRGNITSGGYGFGVGRSGDPALTLTTTHCHSVFHSDVVRKFTPVECERLQGMPDNHTRIAWNGRTIEQCPNSERYCAIGNSMNVKVMAWLGKIIGSINN
jgi:DNA (cytosine-5)-methyltransferase 1